MAYRVKFSFRAESDVREAAAYIRSDSPRAAQRWVLGLREAMAVLRDAPLSLPFIPETDRLGRPYRAIHYYSHRVIYRVDEENAVVYIVRVYHGARRPLEDGDVE